MKKKLIIALSIFVLLASAVVLVLHFRGETKSYFWRTLPAEKGDVNIFVTATGSLAADTSVDVGVQVSGIVAKIKVDFNDLVKKGQVIAVLDTTLYYAAKLDAEAAMTRARVARQEAKREFDRSKNLFENKVAAQADFDLAMTSYLTSQGNFISAQAQLNRAVINLKYCTIAAPIDGVVILKNVQVGNMVIASFSSPVLFTIAYDLRRMQVQANVDEADIGQIKVGQTAKFTVDAFPDDIFLGEVTQIRHQPVMIQNVVNYVVIIEVPNPELKLMPGLTANSNIFVDESKGVLKVPTNAFSFAPPEEYISESTLLSDSVKKSWMKRLRSTSELKKHQIIEPERNIGYLWIKREAGIFPVRVRKGLNDGTFTEVSGAIREGEEVAMGINRSQTTSNSSQSPFMPKFSTPKK